MNAVELIETENRIKDLWEAGELPYLVHLCGGNERWLCDYYAQNFKEGDWVFCSHRTHYHALLYGIEPDDLIERIKRGLSMFVFAPRFVCSAIVGGTLAIATGRALSAQLRGTPEHTHCFCGDGATDQGAFWEAIRFAEGRDLPITFVVEDNGGQCGVSADTRWGKWDTGFIRNTKVRYYSYTPTYPHAGNWDENKVPTRPKLKWQIERSFPKPV